MTPKEKAIELQDKMKSCLFSDGLHDAKQCALIAVDEILELDIIWFDKVLVTDYPKTYKPHQTIEFWNEVKIELEKL